MAHVEAARRAGSKLAVVDAIDDSAAAFYAHHEFDPMPADRRRFTRKLSALANAWAVGRPDPRLRACDVEANPMPVTSTVAAVTGPAPYRTATRRIARRLEPIPRALPDDRAIGPSRSL